MDGAHLLKTLPANRIWLHRVAMVLALGTVLLIAKGGLVHSAGAGLSVPDWPTTYGENMFTYPVEKWTGGIVFEHGHRLIASVIGFLTIIVAVWIWMVETRRWMKWLAGLSLLSVIIQGVLGGMTVLMQLPTAVSVSHAMLAQSFMIMTMAMALATSRRWLTTKPAREINIDAGLRKLLFATFAFTFFQILFGAVTRHTYSGLAIADFPLNNGKIIPDFTAFGVAIHFIHRLGALALTVLVAVQGVKVLRNRELKILRAPMIGLLLMIVVQIALGATVIWTREAIVPNTLHVAGGAIIFALSFAIFFLARRHYVFAGVAPKPSLQMRGAEA